MRDKERIPGIVQKLEQLWRQHPDWRLTQLVINVARTGEVCPGMFNMEDDIFMMLLDKELSLTSKDEHLHPDP